MGAVLSQHQDDGTLRPIAFMSKAFSDVERNYQIHDKEMLAIIRALEEWRHFLEGAEEKFEIHTDHKNLTYFHTAQNLNCCQAHWSLYLSHFNFTLTHHPGKSMGKPDALSCRSDHPKGQGDNSDITLLDPALFEIRSTETTIVEGPEADLLNHIKSTVDFDEPVVKAL